MTLLIEALQKSIRAGNFKRTWTACMEFVSTTEGLTAARFVYDLIITFINNLSAKHMAIVFANRRNRWSFLYHLVLGVFFNPLWLFNRGVWSITGQVCLGPNVAKAIRLKLQRCAPR